ncbi:hypothetical protein OG948_60230 (plasmid) [Embleya sp. NBC_00888]|uniref:hypothetical protein n=1 Tax=Embleya sp. NBC_00888 TaxID=2975960 RepID=UPI002F90AE8B|nr:hypothetical protein OG948_60230 [Embleya sp. NBC_00888]
MSEYAPRVESGQLRLVEVRLRADGTVWVQGRPIAVPAGTTPEQAAIEHVRASVQMLGHRARVRITRPDGSRVEFVMTEDGSTVRVAPAPVDHPAEPMPEQAVPAGAPKPRRWGLVAGLAVLGLIAATLTIALRDDDGAPPSPRAVAGARQGPDGRLPGWSPDAVWQAPIAVPRKDLRNPLVSGRTSAAVIAPDEARVNVLDLRDGHVLASVPFAADAALHGLWKAGELAVVHSGPRLVMVSLDGSPSPTTTPYVPLGSRVSTTGTSLLVTYPGNGAMVLDQDTAQLVNVRLPVGTTQLGADGDTVLSAIDTGTWWRSRAGTPAVEVTPVPPRPGAAVRQVRAGGHDRVTILWSGAREGDTTVAMHDATTGAVVLAVDTPAREIADADWRWDGGPIAALGPLVLDLKRGTGNLVPGLYPTNFANGTLYGRRGESEGIAIAASDPGRVRTLGRDGPLPYGVTSDRALVISVNAAGAMTVFALEPS